MVVDIGGKFNTFHFLTHGRSCTGLKQIVRFSDIPRDTAYVEKNRDSFKNNPDVKLITPTINQFYESVERCAYPNGTVFVCHDTLYYMTQL